VSVLIEPQVLAEAKEFLLPPESEHGYAVVDAQFKTDTWGHQMIDQPVRTTLEPINTLRMANGRPDAVLTPPKSDTYRSDIRDSATALPIAVIEAKGKVKNNRQNTAQVAITQAHRHIGEVNLGFAAVPRTAISASDRSLARELNIGLLAIDQRGAELIEKSHLVGTETSATAETLRFHANLGGTAVENLKKNHPKNALGYALATQHPGDTESVFEKYVIKSVSDARLDATALGLISLSVAGPRLSPEGREAVRTVIYRYGGTETALEEIESLRGSRKRFIDKCPVMATVVRQALLSYPPTQVLLDSLEELAEAGNTEPSLAEVAKAVARKNPNLALDLFISTHSEDRKQILATDSDQPLDPTIFDDGEVYSTHTTFQYKAMLRHVGLVAGPLNDTKSELDPTSSVWKLKTRI
jgi:hypothetical protein